jgi:hypothetical protein
VRRDAVPAVIGTAPRSRTAASKAAAAAGRANRDVRAVEQDPELVPAETGGEIAVAQVAAEACADHRQQLVTHRVAGGVVDGLEVVEVEEQD